MKFFLFILFLILLNFNLILSSCPFHNKFIRNDENMKKLNISVGCIGSGSKPSTYSGFVQPSVLDGTRLHASSSVIEFENPIDSKQLQELKSIFKNFNPFLLNFKKQHNLIDFSASIGFSENFWTKILQKENPTDFHSFKTLKGIQNGSKNYTIENTGGDIFIHTKDNNQDNVYLFNKNFFSQLKNVVNLKTLNQTMGWRFCNEKPGQFNQQNRDLTGFIDGTANTLTIQAPTVIPIKQADSNYINGSFALVQKWKHDLEKFWKLDLVDQENTFGRYKQNGSLLSFNNLPKNSHVHRVNQARHKMFLERQAIPWGDNIEQGLLFIAYAQTVSNFDILLSSMMGHSNPGVPSEVGDAFLSFTQPLQTEYFFIPSIQTLQTL